MYIMQCREFLSSYILTVRHSEWATKQYKHGSDARELTHTNFM